MTIIKVGVDKYINVDRITYVEPARKARLIIHFAIGGGDVAGPSCQVKLDEAEANVVRRWLDDHSQNAAG